MSVYIIEYSHRTYVEVRSQPKHEVGFHLCLKTVIVAFIIAVGSVVIPCSPIQTGKRIEIQVVIQTVSVMRKQMRSAYSQQIKTYRRNISVQ